MTAARPLTPSREPGYYWVRINGKRARSGPQMGRFIQEAWVGVTPWRIDGEWFAEREVEPLSPRLTPPVEEPAR